MKKEVSNGLTLFTWFSVVIAIAFIGFYIFTIPNKGKTEDIKYKINRNNVLIDNYQKKTKKLNVQDVLDKITKQNVNVQTSLNDVTDHIKSGIDLTYNKTKDEKDHDQLAQKLPKLVGDSMSSKLIDLSKPVLNQSGKQTAPFDKTTDVVVAFGKYNYKSTNVPVYVAVNYQTPPVETGSAGHNTGKKALNGQDLYILTYDLKTKKLVLNSYVKGDATND